MLEFEGVRLGRNEPPIVIAEIGINHGGNLEVAKQMARAAVEHGARVIKHQTHIPEAEMSSEANYAIPGNSDKSIMRIMQECALDEEEEFELASCVRNLGAVFLSTPFSREAVDRLEAIGVSAYKIGSGECNNYPFVEYVAKKGKPVILSTGMNTVATIRPSVEIFESFGVPYALMHTTNLYPTPKRLLRLGALRELGESFPDAVLGLSDHSTSNSACLAAVALGARVLERHFTDSKLRVGPDIVCSMDGLELQDLIAMSHEIFEAIGGSKGPAAEETVTMNFAFSSVCATREIAAGEVLSEENIFPLRPSGGDFGPNDWAELLGRRASRTIKARTQLKIDDIE